MAAISCLFNSLYRGDHGATVIVESMSKYMGGGDVIMGMVTGKKSSVMDQIKTYAYHNGIRTSPFDAYTATRSL